jgi:pimeloyl-ACP methyl ester carboxylesterase
LYYWFADVQKLKVFHREAGPRDAPLVLLLHGFPTSSHMYRNLSPCLLTAGTSNASNRLAPRDFAVVHTC